MAIKSRSFLVKGAYNRVIAAGEYQWENSARVNGKLKLSPQFHYRMVRYETSFYSSDPSKYRPSYDGSSTFRYSDLPSAVKNGLYNRALARLTGKLRNGGASLGVTLASWGQARDMINTRLGQILSLAKKAERRLDKKLKNMSSRERSLYRRRLREKGANALLEFQFGWQPLYQDVVAALTTLWNNPVEEPFVRASSKSPYTTGRVSQTILYDENLTLSAQLRCVLSGKVFVSSQNLWLANRAGLINLPGIAWDLVPWSFLVNMFTNMGQMVSAMSDFVGLTFGQQCTTTVAEVTAQYAYTGKGSAKGQFWGNTLELNNKNQSVGPWPYPSFEWRCPQLNLGSATITIGLLVQQLGRLGRKFGAI